MKTLLDLYKSHTGKVSDKWALYLREYDRLFAPYREQAISMLEIGIQNGGSLEIWSQYFPNAQKFVGCDINPDCAKLTYADPRIAVVVGDATTPETQAKVLAQSTTFDLIIEDGSHTSSDIVKAFARYFPALKTGGLFVAEDLHCSYWQDYEGGIFHPYSSITFFKQLADMVNHEHWGVEKSRTELIAGFKQVLNVDFDESLLGQISSVEFVNSICVVRKSNLATNCLGGRVIAGMTELVVGGHLPIAGTELKAPVQTSNIWSNLIRSPAESYQDQLHEINMGKELLAQQRAVVERIRNEVQAKQAEVEQLHRDVQAKHAEVAYLNHLVSAMQSSRSWRYTAPLRKAGSLARPVFRVFRRVRSSARQNGGYVGLAFKALALLRHEGWQGIRLRLSGVQPSAPVMTPEGQAVDRNDYQAWIKLYDTLDAQAIERIQAEIASFEKCPKISVVMPVYNAPLEFLKQAIESVQAQLYPNWELCIADDASTDKRIRPLLESYAHKNSRIKLQFRSANGHISAASNSALELATGEYVALLDHDDALSIDALFWVVDSINKAPNTKLIYSDEDKINRDGMRCEPFFKPDWSPHLALSQAYLGHLIVFDIRDEKPSFNDNLIGAQDYDLWLSLANKLKRDEIFHIPRILYHWRKHEESTAENPSSKLYADDAGYRAVKKYMCNRYSDAKNKVEKGNYLFTYKCSFDLASDVGISIIIPTKDRVDLLSACINSILNKTTYKNYEIIVLNNNSIDAETFKYFEHLKAQHKNIKVIDANIDFNWSRLNNIGVTHASGDVYIFLNNDTSIISPDWLSYLAGYALLPDVGVVGALLLFEDGSIQHSGVVVGMGGWADHVYRTMQPVHSSGSGFVSSVITRNVLAVTGACMAIAKDKFYSIGGFDEDFIICGSDVELCIRAHKNDFYNVMCAEAKLFHYESKTRSSFVPDIDFEQSRKKYEPYRTEKTDIFYNRNLSLVGTYPSLDGGPRDF